MLTAAYYIYIILRDDLPSDIGAGNFLRRDKTKLARHLVRRLQDLGPPG